MAFHPSFDAIKSRVYLVGRFNDADITRQSKFFVFGKQPNGVSLAEEGDVGNRTYSDFVRLVEPQDKEAQSGVLYEDSWFFRVGG